MLDDVLSSYISNPGKKISIIVDSITYLRYPVRTKAITAKDNLDTIIRRFVCPLIKQNDILIISERIVAITQGRSFLIQDIKPSWWAHFLSRFVSKHPGGIGLKSSYTMELAIREATLFRILFASVIAMLTRPFGVRGLFYHFAGSNINAIDGPCEYSFPPGNKSAKLGPKNPMEVAMRIAKLFNLAVAIIDANDYGMRVLGCSKEIDKNLIKKIFRDNPLGQSCEQTPFGIVRSK